MINRLMTALRAGFTAFTRYDPNALIPLTPEQWDDYDARAFRYHLMTLYYYNKVYTDIEKYRAQHFNHSTNGKLYRHTRGIYNPIQRLTDIYPAKVYGGQLDLKELNGGAIPIVDASDTVIDAIRQIWQWSNWQANKQVYVRQGALFGDSFLKIVDDRAARRVRLEPVHPAFVYDADFDAVGNIKRVVLVYQKIDKRDGRTYEYQEIIDQNTFSTFRDGSPYAWYEDASGNPIAEWRNDYGFVPMIHTLHKSTGTDFGMGAGVGVLSKVDELNSMASALNDQIRKVVNPIWKGLGLANAIIEMTLPDDNDKIPVLTLPKDADLEALVVPLDLDAAQSNVHALLQEIERDTPELSLHRLRDGGNLTAPGVRAAYSDAIGMIEEAAGNYDAGLIRAQQMAMTIGGLGGYNNMTAFDLGSYERGDLEHSIGERSIISDALTETEIVGFLLQLREGDNLDQTILDRLGVSLDTTPQMEQQSPIINRLAELGRLTREQRTESQVDDANEPVTTE